MHGQIQWVVVSASLFLFSGLPTTMNKSSVKFANLFSPDLRIA